MARILFCGTSDFAVPSLEALAQDSRFEIIEVLTQPDKPVGRGHRLAPPPIKEAALKHNIPVSQPTSLKPLENDLEFRARMTPPPDTIVVVSYGKILPAWFLHLAQHGAVNVHGSLLPRWRGASPIQAAIAAGDLKTGVTIMKLDELLDHGPILAMQEELIRVDDTAETLHDRLAQIGAQLLPEVLIAYLEGKVIPQEQDHTLATTCGRLTKEMGTFDAHQTAETNERLIRAHYPWPGTSIIIAEQPLKILQSHVGQNHIDLTPGTRVIENGYPAMICEDQKSLVLLKVQPQGKSAMDGAVYLNGHRQRWLSL
jgi:methionyl-tRNA formyltransferase